MNIRMEDYSESDVFNESSYYSDWGSFTIPHDNPLVPHIIYAVIITLIAIAGIFGNTLVILAIILSRKLRSTTNWFVMNLACADLLTCICMLCYPALYLASFDVTKLRIVAPNIAITCVGVSLTTHAIIGFKNWYLITKSQADSARLFVNRKICVMVTMSWILAGVFAYVIHLSSEGDNEYIGRCIFGVWVIVHFGIVALAYALIWRFVVHQETIMQLRLRSFRQSESEMSSTSKDPPDLSYHRERSTNDTMIQGHEGSSSVGFGLECNESCNTVSFFPDNHDPTDGTKNRSADIKESEECKIPINAGNVKVESLTDKGNEASDEHKVTPKDNPVDDNVFSTTEEKRKKRGSAKRIRKSVVLARNLFVVLAAFAICFIPYSISLYFPNINSHVTDSFLALLFLNSSLNPLIYARRISSFRQVMGCIVRFRFSTIPMPIECLRRITHVE